MSKSVFSSNKILVLQQIREKKSILFGKFSDEVCKAQKIDAWKEIHNLALSMGVVGPDKQWTYTRDVFWQNARKSTMKKVDNQKQTGSAGGPECRLNTMDNIVLDIIGRDSSVLTDLGVAETWSGEQDPPEQAERSSFEVEVPAGNVVAPAVPEATTSAATASTSSIPSTPATSTRARVSLVSRCRRRLTRISPLQRRRGYSPQDVEEARDRRVFLQNTLLEHQVHHKKLQILKIEEELKLPHSQFTDELLTVEHEEVIDSQEDLQ